MTHFQNINDLLLIVITVDVEVAELVHLLARGYNMEEIPELLLLEVLLGQILQVTFGKWELSSNSDLGVAVQSHLNFLAQVSLLSVDFDSVVKEVLQVLSHHDIVINRLLTVNGEVDDRLLALHGSL